MKGMLDPDSEEKVIGKQLFIETFKVSKVEYHWWIWSLVIRVVSFVTVSWSMTELL